MRLKPSQDSLRRVLRPCGACGKQMVYQPLTAALAREPAPPCWPCRKKAARRAAAPEERRGYRCGSCGRNGHNRSTCENLGSAP